MKRSILILLLLLGWVSFGSPASVLAQGEPPVSAAEEIRSLLFEAQRTFSSDPISTAQKIQEAQSVYGSVLQVEIVSAQPENDQRIIAGFAEMRTALTGQDAPGFAAARSEVWTAVLRGSMAVVESAIRRGEPTLAQSWLQVREFRTATRFSRPNADATLALQNLTLGQLTPELALQYVHADLYDTYQARLNETLRELEEADQKQFTSRRAELAGLVKGYFLILSPAFKDQHGEEAQRSLLVQVDTLVSKSVAGKSVEQELVVFLSALENFRAAPLSPAEQSRRAGQLLRYLKLVPVEYARGVSGGVVTRELEIQEAITFYQAAQAAFEDLSSLMAEKDAETTAAVKADLSSLGQALTATSTQVQVADPQQIQKVADSLQSQLNAIMPAEWLQASSSGDFDVIDSMLNQMETATRSGEYELAESARLEAYAVLESGPEAKLSVVAPQAKIVIEDLFWNGQGENKGLAYLIAQQAPLTEIKASRQALSAELKTVQPLLEEQSAPAAVVTNAGIIVFREGLEAILILASLLASFKGAESARYRRPMWVGTVLALLATVLTWFLARSILSSLARYGERLEAVVSIIAVGVLLLITNWFFHKTYWSDHLAGFHAKKRSLLSAEAGITLGLISLGFTSVYREGFEVVLFLQALVLEGNTQLVLLGIGVGLAATLLIGLVTFKLQAHLPYMQMLVITGMMIGAVLLIMIGKTVHVLQVVGWLPTSPIGSIVLPFWSGTWLGTYATWEGVLLQFVAGVFVVGSYYFAEGKRTGKPVSLLKRALNFKR
ncbi:MAG: FTR1 family protein [Anaerolineaceae bacterium]|nr:FTR1 family protein [Anaerolineaceae bacterium]